MYIYIYISFYIPRLCVVAKVIGLLQIYMQRYLLKNVDKIILFKSLLRELPALFLESLVGFSRM